MSSIPNSELIINPDGSIYHLNLQADQIAPSIITVGDPDRVAEVSKYFDRIDIKVRKREFVTHTGELNGKRISVISTGIGTDNIDIVLNELDALVNIDLKTRRVKEEHTVLDIIRIGTSGALQTDIPIDSFVCSRFAIGLDGLMHYYDFQNNANETIVFYEFMQSIGAKTDFPIRPYLAESNEALIAQLGKGIKQGITVTCPGFYAPQGRQLRAEMGVNNLLEHFPSFKYRAINISNFEMETAGIYGLSRILGHRALSFNAILANRITNEFSKDPKTVVDQLIQLVLNRVAV